MDEPRRDLEADEAILAGGLLLARERADRVIVVIVVIAAADRRVEADSLGGRDEISRVVGTWPATYAGMPTATTIRAARLSDVPAVRTLVASALGDSVHLDERDLTCRLGRRYVLVLEAADGLAAAALLNIEHDRGVVEWLAVAPTCHDRGVEKRLLGVAHALCAAFDASAPESASSQHISLAA